jgi:hypothetical protein
MCEGTERERGLVIVESYFAEIGLVLQNEWDRHMTNDQREEFIKAVFKSINK